MWKPIKNYEDLYLVSDTGEVFSKKRNIVMKTRLDKDGYLVIGLTKDGVQTTHKIHRVVAESFLQQIDGTEVDHINGCKTDNRVENLQWISKEKNLEKRDLSNLQTKVARVDKNTGLILEEYVSVRDASRDTNIPHSNISNCINGNRKTAGGFVWKKLN